jgi:DNA-binding MarR family transcriptional regulator
MAKCAMDARVSRYDVTPVQAHVLMYLHQHGGQAPQRELTEFLRAKPSTVNGVLDRMEEKGLVRRSVIGEDARRRLITLTDKGREQQSRFTESFLANEEAMVRGFSPAERETLLELLERIVENLKEELRT